MFGANACLSVIGGICHHPAVLGDVSLHPPGPVSFVSLLKNLPYHLLEQNIIFYLLPKQLSHSKLHDRMV